tara:strand:- start:148 stop:429 length:282 start_codon:yes stop_codon:yes gene_type:complete
MVALIDQFKIRAKENFNNLRPRRYIERNTPKLPSLTERIIALENENKRLNKLLYTHHSSSPFSGLIPEDTLDLALFVSITVLLIYLGKTVYKF